VWFVEQLTAQGVEVTAAIVNRAHPLFGDGSSADALAAAEAASNGGAPGLDALWRNVADLRTLRERELDVIEPLATRVGTDRVVVLPLLDRDVHDLAGLHTMGTHLFDHPAAER
jgi:hypothetical protein